MTAWTALFLSLFTSPMALVSSQTVLTIESDAMPGITTVDVLRDAQGRLAGLKSLDPEGHVVSYTLAQLRQGPQLFKEMDGYNVIYFSVESDFTETTGGHADMYFLRSGISNTYKDFRMNVVVRGDDIKLYSEPNPNDPNSDENPYRGEFNYLFMNKNTFWGTVIGIEDVVPQLR